MSSSKGLSIARQRIPALAGAWLGLSVLACAQQTSATLIGVVKDQQGAEVPKAKVVLINQDQGAMVREMTTEADGSFTILPLHSGTYGLTVEAAGFKKFEQKDIRLFASDRISLPNVALSLGALPETVEVSAQSVQLETQSAMRSGVVTGGQTINLALNGRSYMDPVRTTPRVVANLQPDVRLGLDREAPLTSTPMLVVSLKQSQEDFKCEYLHSSSAHPLW